MNNEVTEGKRLSKIKFSGGEIEFIATNSRWDLTGNNPGDKSLDYILIKNHTGTVIRKFKFNYKFMYENSLLNAPVSGYVNSDATKYRLTLTSVQEFDALEKNSKPPYKFDYILGLPKRLSKAVDFWGFYNGKTTNTTLIPAHVNASGVRFEGADRNPSILHAQKGTLNKITYPTGGFTDFYYEINEANRGLPKTRPGSATLNSDVWNGVWNKTQQKVSFEINSVGGDGVWVLLDLSQLPCGKNNQPYNSCGMFVGISTDINGNLGTQIFNSLSISDLSTKKIYLPNGKYFLHVGLTPSDNINTTYNAFSFILNWEEMTGEINDHDIGGIRLAKMIDTDPILNKTITKNYEYKIGSPTGLSSGRVSYLPLSFNYRFQSEKMHTSVLYTEYGYTLYDVYSSTPNVPLTYTQGAVVGYKEVTVYYEESNGDKGINGKTIYKYTSPEQFPDLGFLNGFPFPHVETRDWQRGLLLESIDYKRVGTGYIPVKKTTNTYFMNDEHSGNPNIKNNIGLKVGFSTSGPLTVVFNYQYYNFHTGYVEKTSSLETFYNSDGTQESSKTTKYQYSTDHLMPIKISNNTSDGSWLTSINTYPSDYSNTSGEIYQLKNANILNVPIEEVVIKSDNEQGTNSRIISGKLTSYTWYPAVVGIGGYPDRFYKYKEYYLETATPIASSNFQFSSRSTSNLIPPAGATSLFYQNPLYKERVIYNFSGEKGNINTYTQDGYKVSILWGYNNSLPIAKVINADRYSFFEDRTVQTDCLYNGFESGISPGEAGWYNFDATKVIIDKNTEPDNVHSGRYSVKLNPAPTGGVNYGPVCDMIPINQKVKYKLSCWIKTPIGFPANSAALNMYTMEKNKCCDAYPAVSANNSYLTISPTNNEWKYIETIINTDNYPYYTNEFVLRTYALNYSNTHPLYIDDIRIHPVDAQMETYNYDTQVGVSSTISPDNKLNIYEYDSLGRLLNIKDQNGNIIKSFNYIYGNK